MSAMTISKAEDRLAMAPYAIAAALWAAVICLPILYVLGDVYQLGTKSMVLGGLLLVNGSVGIFWILSAIKSLLVAGVSGMTEAVMTGGSESGDEAGGSAGNGLRFEREDNSMALINPGTGLEMNGAFDASGRSLGED